MNDFFSSSAYLGLLLTLGTFQLARAVNRRAGRELCSPLLFATVLCCLFLLGFGVDYQAYYDSGAGLLDALLTPATICLAIPLYRQFRLLKENAPAALAGCAAGVLTHMLLCVLLLVVFRLEGAEYITLLPKSITTAIGKSLSAELGGYPAVTMAAIMVTGLFGATAAPGLLRLFRVTEPLAQGLAIGTASHAAGTSRAVQLGDVQGAASSLAIVVTGLLTILAAPLFAQVLGVVS